jgi:hypothetical protein
MRGADAEIDEGRPSHAPVTHTPLHVEMDEGRPWYGQDTGEGARPCRLSLRLAAYASQSRGHMRGTAHVSLDKPRCPSRCPLVTSPQASIPCARDTHAPSRQARTSRRWPSPTASATALSSPPSPSPPSLPRPAPPSPPSLPRPAPPPPVPPRPPPPRADGPSMRATRTRPTQRPA